MFQKAVRCAKPDRRYLPALGVNSADAHCYRAGSDYRVESEVESVKDRGTQARLVFARNQGREDGAEQVKCRHV